MTTAVGIIIALLCAVGALIYGVQSIQWILAKDPGNARMQEIATAIQEGAGAYLNRQYTTRWGPRPPLVSPLARSAPGSLAISACTCRFALMSAPPRPPMTG